MTICNENEIDHEKWIIQLIDLDVDMNTMQNIACISKIMSICNKQHLSNI